MTRDTTANSVNSVNSIDLEEANDDNTPQIAVKYNTLNTVESDDKNVLRGMKLCISTILIIIYSPFIICDLYYAYTDNSCVHIPASKMSVNMYTYLLVSGYNSLCVCMIYVIGIICVTDKPEHTTCINNMIYCIVSTITCMSAVFSVAWVIVGAVIWWNEIDNATCSRATYNYVMASIIIKIVAIFIAGCMASKSDNKH